MGRNFAALFFLAYAFFLTLLSRKRLLAKPRRRYPLQVRRALSGAVNFFFLKKLKKVILPSAYRLHYFNTAFLFSLVGVRLIFGWFAVFAVPLVIADTLAILLSALEISLLVMRENLRLFGRPLVLYAADPDPQSRRAFVSSAVDAIFYVLIPLVMILCTYFL